jgi:hypothetical protein
MIPVPPPERRQAIWPWLVMPLATLALFYGLDSRLKHSQDQGLFGRDSQTSVTSPDR